MTYIEFIDESAIENVCAALTLAPDRVILIGNNTDELSKCCYRYERLLKSKGRNVDFVPCTVSDNNLKTITDILEDVILKETNEQSSECVIDLTGGNDLYLTAAGIVYGRLSSANVRINLIRLDILRGRVIDADGDGLPPSFPPLSDISVEDNIGIYGGKVVYEREKRGTTYSWTVDEDLKSDVSSLWEMCKRNISDWNTQTLFLDIIEDDDSIVFRRNMTTKASFEKIDRVIIDKRNKGKFNGRKTPRDISSDFLSELVEKGFLKSCMLTNDGIELEYRDEKAKRLITKSGQVLEMAVYLAAYDIKSSDGKKVYNDVMTGVTIDWDGEIVEKESSRNDGTPWYVKKNKQDTENEIDVMMMRGMIPIFISCKNGRVDMDELYKLETVANRFGGKYAKKMLIAANLGYGEFTWDLLARAKEMDIKVLYENFNKSSLQQIQQKIKDALNSCLSKE